MFFKVQFQQEVNSIETVEAIIECDSLDGVEDKLLKREFFRYLPMESNSEYDIMEGTVNIKRVKKLN